MAKVSITGGDKLVIVSVVVICLLVAGIFFWQSRHGLEGSYVAVMKADTGEEIEYSLKGKKCIEVQGFLGISVIEISQGKARFINSPCPDNVCVEVFGWIEKEGEISLCLPNQILLEIRNH